MAENIVSTPTHERCVTSYAARTQYKPGVVHPPHIKVKDAIDIHCHAHEGQQDALGVTPRRFGLVSQGQCESDEGLAPVPKQTAPGDLGLSRLECVLQPVEVNIS